MSEADVSLPTDPDESPAAAERRAELLGRVLAGGVTDADACRELGVTPTALARWKLQALESLEELRVPEDAGSAGPPAAPAPGPDRRARPTSADVARRVRTRPRTVAAAAVGTVGVVFAVALASPAGGAGIELADALTRWVMYVATLLAVGGVAYLWLVDDRAGDEVEQAALRWWVQAAALVGVVTTLVALATHGAVLADAGAFGLLDHHSMARAAHGAFGASVVLRVLGLVYVAYAVRRIPASSARLVAVVGALIALTSFLLVGHTATSEPRALVVVANLVHTLAGAVWFGGLVALAVTLRHRRATGRLPSAAGLVRRFSSTAMVVVAAVVVAGTGLALVEIPGPAALVSSAYGLTLLTKLALVAGVLVSATYNQRRLVPAVSAGRTSVFTQLRRTVGVELVGLLLVLLATALLVNLAPPT